MDVTLQALSNVATFVFIASVKGTVLVLLVLALQKLLGRWLSAQGRFLLWFPVVLGLLSPLGFDAALPTESIAAARPLFNVPEAAAETRSSNPGLPAAFSPPAANMQSLQPGPPTPAYPRAYALLYFWVAGVLAVLGVIAVSVWRVARLVRRAVPVPAAVQELLEACMTQTQVRTPVTALQSDAVVVPMIAGAIRPVLLLPAALEPGLTRAQLRHIFIHELMHLKRGDIVSNWFVALAQALHWFNPAVWFAFHYMRQDRELACDAATLRHLAPAERHMYGHTLLQLNDVSGRRPVPAIALGILEPASHMQRRIHMLVQLPRSRKLQTFFATVALLPLAAVAISQPVPAPAPVAPQVVVALPAAPVEPAPDPLTPTFTAQVTVAESAPAVLVSGTADESMPPPANPAADEVRVNPAASLTQALPVTMPGSAAPEIPLLAQVEMAPPVDAFALPAVDSTHVIAAVTTAQTQAAAEPAADIPRGVLQMTDEINALKSEQMRVIDEWNGNAVACEARREDSLLGVFSKPCRDVRVVQIRGDVFRFVYACHVLRLQQQAQWGAWREAVAQQQAGIADVESILRANERELSTFCDLATYAEEYPGFSSMLEDAVALKYYNPWYSPRFTQITPDPYGSTYDPLYMSRMSDMPAR